MIIFQQTPEREKERERERETERDRDRETERDKETERDRERQREIERETERELFNKILLMQDFWNFTTIKGCTYKQIKFHLFKHYSADLFEETRLA